MNDEVQTEELPPVTIPDFHKGIEEVIGIMGEVYQLQHVVYEAAKELFPEGHRSRKEILKALTLFKKSAKRLVASYRSAL